MSERAERLKTSWESRTSGAVQKARSAISQLIASEEEVTFTAIHKVSGVSKTFLYKNEEIRAEIENTRKETKEIAEVKRQKRIKTKQSRDVIIESKDRRIKKLEEENRRLKLELDTLRGRLYDKTT